MILFQTIRKKWDLTCTVYYNLGAFGHIALPFEISWWFSTDAKGNRCREISFSLSSSSNGGRKLVLGQYTRSTVY